MPVQPRGRIRVPQVGGIRTTNHLRLLLNIDFLSSLFRGHSLCLLDVLLAFPTCHPPAEALLEHLPRLAPRPYSAASIQRDGHLLDLVFNVAEIPSGPARAFSRRGVCTGWFEDMAKSGNLQKVSKAVA